MVPVRCTRIVAKMMRSVRTLLSLHPGKYVEDEIGLNAILF